MPNNPKLNVTTLREIQELANAHAVEVLKTVPFNLPEMDEDAYAEVMNTIVQQLVTSFAKGYAAAKKG